MLTREDLQAIAGLLVPLETRIGELETKFDKFEIRVGGLEANLLSVDKHVCELDMKVAQLNTKVTELDGKVAQLDTKVTELDGKVTQLDVKVSEVDNSVRSLWIHVENQTEKQLHIVAENYSNLTNKLDELQKMKGVQDTLLFYANKHENDIRAIKQRLCM